MKMRSLMFLSVVAIIGATGLAACKRECDDCGWGGGGIGGGAGGAPACASSCAAAITDNQDLCSDVTATSMEAWDALHTCAADDAVCGADCGYFNQGGPMDAACGTCLSESTCTTDFQTCQNDV